MKAIDYIRRSAFPCDEAKIWLEDYNYDVDAAWKHCTHPDWMLWALHNVKHRPTGVAVRAVLCDLAESYIEYLESKSAGPFIALRDVIDKVRFWLGKARDTGFADYGALEDIQRDCPRHCAAAGAMTVDLCSSWCWGCGRGSSAAANEFMFSLIEAIDSDELPVFVRKRMCRIIRAAVPVFPVVD